VPSRSPTPPPPTNPSVKGVGVKNVRVPITVHNTPLSFSFSSPTSPHIMRGTVMQLCDVAHIRLNPFRASIVEKGIGQLASATSLGRWLQPLMPSGGEVSMVCAILKTQDSAYGWNFHYLSASILRRSTCGEKRKGRKKGFRYCCASTDCCETAHTSVPSFLGAINCTGFCGRSDLR